MNQPLKKFKEAHGCSYSAFAERYGLNECTVRWRWWNGHRSMRRLTAAPRETRKKKKVGGKTFDQWSAWFACRGINRAANSIRGSWNYYQRRRGLSQEDAMREVVESTLRRQLQ